jgi:hypothetical protein
MQSTDAGTSCLVFNFRNPFDTVAVRETQKNGKGLKMKDCDCHVNFSGASKKKEAKKTWS